MREENKAAAFTPDVIKSLLSGLQNGEMLTIEMTSAECNERVRRDGKDGKQ